MADALDGCYTQAHREKGYLLLHNKMFHPPYSTLIYTADWLHLHALLGDCTDKVLSSQAGWLGDAHVGSETVFRNYDASGAYRLFVEMIAESLDDEGNPPDVVPFLGGHGVHISILVLRFLVSSTDVSIALGGSGTPTWTAAFPIISALLVEHGDEQIPMILYADSALL